MPKTADASARKEERRSISMQIASTQTLVAMVVLLAGLVTFLTVRATERRLRDIEDDALLSLELLGEIREGAVRQNMLGLDASLQDRTDLVELRQTLAALHARVDQAAATYAPMTHLPGENEGWLRLKGLLQRNQASLDRFLTTLQSGDPAAIREGRATLVRDSLQLEEATEHQNDINRRYTHRLAKDVQQLHRRTMDVLLLALVGLVLVAEVVLAQAARRLHDQARLIDDQLRDLESMVVAREDLVASTSHELKTPITALLLLAEQLSRAAARAGEGPSLEPLLRRVQLQSQRVSRMLDRILDLTVLREGGLELHPEPVDAAALAREVAADLEGESESVGSPITVEAEGEVRGLWDRARLERSLAGLISNALKFGEGKPVRVRVWVEGGEAHFEVEDHGAGIAESDQARIFERFGRAAPGHRRVWGLGLGLWSIRALAEAHGGSLQVRSQLGAGSTFTLVLPLTPDFPAHPGRGQPEPRLDA